MNRLIFLTLALNLLGSEAEAKARPTCPLEDFKSICLDHSQSVDQLEAWAHSNSVVWDRKRGSNKTFGLVIFTNANGVFFSLEHFNYADLISFSCDSYPTDKVVSGPSEDVPDCDDVMAKLEFMVPKGAVLEKVEQESTSGAKTYSFLTYQTTDERVTIEVFQTMRKGHLPLATFFKLNIVVVKGAG